jgi:hypothetical protein
MISSSGYSARESERIFNSMQSKSISFSYALGAPMELRREIRYRLDAPALFYWESAQHKRLRGEGVTRDISVFGAFILTPTCPPIDVPIQVEVVLPSLTGLKPVLRVSGAARVLRVEHRSKGEGENGFAVVSEDFSRWSVSTESTESAFIFAANGGVLGSNGHD